MYFPLANCFNGSFSGAYAVIEKTLATTIEQINMFGFIIAEQTISRFLFVFHKRYRLYNQWINADFNMVPGDPISIHCLVYEEPLPDKHWYQWTSSGNYIVSCACHWIDHFVFVNDYGFVYKQWA